uniref:AttH domain-containing protein n=1 Tax=Panagrolaimus sp. ES5 TaxID=591445 RepID=A0AC34FUK4_9BILA
MSRSINFLIFLVAILAVIFYNLNVSNLQLPKSKFLGPIQHGSPKNSSSFGRYTKPLEILDFSSVSSSAVFNFTALKHWDFKAITTQKYFVAVAIANLNYISTAFVYVIDRSDTSQSKIYQYSSKSIFAQGIKEQSFSSINNGCTKFYQSSNEWIWICYDKTREAYEINGTVVTEKNEKISFNFKIEYSVEKHPSLALIYPVADNQPVYTHKVAGLPSSGSLKVGDSEEEDLIDGLGSMDWTLGYPERVCQWKWSSLSVFAKNPSNNKSVALGINLSDLVYNDVNGVSMESVIWIDNNVYAVEKLAWKLPKPENLLNQKWQIFSISENDNPDSPIIRLYFQPWGALEEHINAIVVQADFVQAFGTYHGTIEMSNVTYIVENGFGVAEKHFSKW